MAYTVYLDAGHGGYDAGATDGNRKEKDDALELTLAVGQILQDNGVDVGYTRVEDVYDSPVRKAQIANEAGADLFVSFHRNAAERRNQYNGVQTLVFENTGLKKELADAINQALAEVGFVNIGTEVRRDLAVLRRTQMPALLVEAGFIDSDTDNEIFDENFDDMARAIAYAILDTLKANGLVSGNSVRTMAAAPQMQETYSGRMGNENVSRGSQGRMGQGAAAGNASSAVAAASRSAAAAAAEILQNRMSGNAVSRNRTSSGTASSQNGMTAMTTGYPAGMGSSAAGGEGQGNAGAVEQLDNTNGSGAEEIRIGRRVGGMCVCIGDDDSDDDNDDGPAYQIQTGLYRNYANALRQRRRLEKDGFPAMIQLYKQYFAVVTGYYDSAEDAMEAEKELRTLGYDTLIRTVR